MNKKIEVAILAVIFMFTSSLSYSAVSGTVDRSSSQDAAIQSTEISQLIRKFSKAFQKGNIDEYMSFYSQNAMENGVNNYEKIMEHYLLLTKNNIITVYDIEISDIKHTGDSVIVDTLYNKTVTEKSKGETFITSGSIRFRLQRESSDIKIAAIDYDKHIRSDYIIGSEDVIEVSVWKSPDLSTIIMVRPDGMISLPLIGDIQASNRSANELKDQIEKKLAEYKQDPIVSIIVKEANSQAIYVTGEVTRPGKYPLRSDITIVQAITLAGGFTQWADKDKIVVIRKSPMVPEGNRFTLKYSDIVTGKNMKANILLKAGDTVIVP